MINKTLAFLSKMNTIQLIMLPGIIGISVILISLGVANLGHIGNLLGGFLLAFGLFILGFMGLPMIVRKELPFFIPIRGWIAVVEGIILLVIWWGAAIGFVGFLLSTR